jgi:hypothetical protein
LKVISITKSGRTPPPPPGFVAFDKSFVLGERQYKFYRPAP